MLNTSLFTLFLITSGVNIASPGIGFVMLMSVSLQHGWRRCIIPAFGLGIGIGILFSISLSGVGYIIASSPVLFSCIKLTGAVFLAYLAWRSWNAPVRNLAALQEGKHPSRTQNTFFLQAVVVSLTNPQPIVFGISVFPQFIDLNLPFLPQVAVMISIYIVMVFLFGMAYAVAASQMRGFIQGEYGLRVVNRTIAMVFVVLACLILWMTVSSWFA